MDRNPLPDTTDERRFERFDARISRSGTSDGEHFTAEIYNISIGGLLLCTDQDFGIGQYIIVDLPEAGPREAFVVWRNGAFHGCEFAKPLHQAALSAVRLASLPDSTAVIPDFAEPDTFADRLRWARQRAKLTQVKLAEQIGVSAPALSNWETGTATPTQSHMQALIQALPQLGYSAGLDNRTATYSRKRDPIEQLREALAAVLLPDQRVSGIELKIELHVEDCGPQSQEG